jgi:hypothetical protein
MAIGLSNVIIFIPGLDGSIPFILLFEKFWGKKKTVQVWKPICTKTIYWLLILNLLSMPWLGWLIYKGYIL